MLRPLLIAEPVRVIGPGCEAGEHKIESRLDPNTAAWYDLDRLPGIGETTAKRIVSYRETKQRQWRKDHPGNEQAVYRVFRRPEDLLDIKGIGPKLLGKVTPYLIFDHPSASVREPAAALDRGHTGAGASDSR